MSLQQLLDQNLAPRLATALAHRFPRIAHVEDFGLQQKPDADIWRFAREGGWTIITKDSDFADLAILHGPPPQVIWIRLGNCPTARIMEVLEGACARILLLSTQPDQAVIEIA